MFNQKEYMKKYYQNNKKKFVGYAKKYNQSKKGKKKIKEYRLKNKEKIRQHMKKYFRERRKDESYLLKKKHLTRLRRVIIRYLKEGKIVYPKLHPLSKYFDLPNINYDKIIENLKPFPKDIKNYQIDHIIPLCKFNFKNPREIESAYDSKNLQLLTIKENRKKGSKIIID